MRVQKFFRYLTMSLILIAVAGCEYDEYPDPVWDSKDAGEPTPVISSVDPASYTLTGTGDLVTITGSGFSENGAGNVVFFGSFRGDVLEFSATEIVVLPPVVSASDLSLRVGAMGAYEFGVYSIPYELEKVAITFHSFNAETQIPLAMDLDPDGNLYVLIADQGVGRIIKLDAFGEETVIAEDVSFADYAPMHYAPGPALLNTKFTAVYKTPIIADSVLVDPGKYFTGNVKKRNTDFDFDQYGNMYFTGKEYLTLLSAADTTSSYVSQWPSTVNLLTCKVYDNYVYTSSETQIFRNQIMDATGTLGAIEDVFDFSSMSGVMINAMTLSSTGDIVVACDSLPGNGGNVYPLYKIANVNDSWTGSTPEPLYPSALEFPAKRIVWGGSTYLYLISNEKIVRVNMRQDGSTYYGREL